MLAEDKDKNSRSLDSRFRGNNNCGNDNKKDVFDNAAPAPQEQVFEYTGDKLSYVSLTEAASHTRFSQEYLSLLVRQKKIAAQKFGRNWKVQLAEVESYIAKVDLKTREREGKQELIHAPAIERGIAKTVNALNPFVGDIYNPLTKYELTNFARHRFQSVMASFLILTTVAMSCFFWFEPASAAKLELGFQKTAARAVTAIAQTSSKLKNKIAGAGLAFIKQGGKVIASAEEILNNDSLSRAEQLKKIGAGALLKVGAVGALADRGLSVLENRAEKRQQYLLSSLSRSVSDSLKTLNDMSGDLAAGARQTFYAPLSFIPAPIRYALSLGANSANKLALIGTGKIEQYKNNLIRANGAQVAGIAEENNFNNESLGKKFLSLINETAGRQQNLAAAAQNGANKTLNNFLDQERFLGTAILKTFAAATNGLHNFVAQKMNAGKEQVLGVKIAAEKADDNFLQKVDNTLLAANDGVNFAQNAWQAEDTESKRSLVELWYKVLDFIMPDALKQKYAEQSAPKTAEKIIAAGPQAKTVIIREQAAAATPATNKLTVKGDASIGGQLEVAGATNLKGGLTVAGAANFYGPIIAESDIKSAGTISAKNLTITDAGTIGSLHVLQNAAFDNLVQAGVLNVSGNANVGGTLIVSGHTIFKSLGVEYDLSSNRSLSTGGSLSVGKDGTIEQNLNVKQDLDVDRNANVDGALTVDGNAALGGNTTMSGNATIKGNTTVSGSLSAATTTISADLTVSGTSTIAKLAASDIAVITASSTETAVIINQQGTGNIMQLQDNGTAVLTALDGGNIGIGTTSPYARVSLWSPTTNTGATIFNIIDNASSTLLTVLDSGYVGIGTTTPRGLFSINDPAGVDPFVVGSSTPKFIIKDSGFVGIGTSSPLTTFSVVGNSYLDGNVTITGPINYASSATTTFGGPISSASGNFIVASSGTTNNLLLNPYGGNVGIGTAAPTYSLDVAGNGRFTSYVDASYFVATSTTATSTFAGGLTAANNFYILQNGKVGIGTTTPTVSLAIGGTDAIVLPFGTTVQRPASGLTGMIRYNTDTSTFEGYGNNNWTGLGGVIDVDQDTKILAETSSGADEDALFFYTAGTEKMRLNANGFLGIGTTSPASILTVWATSTGAALFSAVNTSSSTLFTILNSGNVGIGTTTPRGTLGINDYAGVDPLVVGSSTPKFIVKDSGNVGIGTANPSQLFEINKSQDAATSFYVINPNTTGTAARSYLLMGSSDTGGNYGYFGYFNAGYTDAGTIYKPNRLVLEADGAATNGLALGALSATGFISFYTGGEADANERMRISNTGNVGIGNILPTYKFDVTGAAHFTSYVDASYFVATTTTATSTFAGGLSAASSLYVLQNGNIGIGTMNPGVKMQVVGQSGTGNIGVMNITGYDSFGQSLVMQLPSAGYTGNLVALMKAAGGSGQAMGFSTHFTADAVDRFSIMNHSGAENLTVLDTGNVGIGTTTPYSKLTVWGASATAGNALEVVNNASTTLLTIQNIGNVGIGTTTPFTNLSVVGNGYFSGTLTSAGLTTLGNSSTTQATIGNMYLRSNTISATDDNGLYLYDNASNGLYIQDGGNVGIGTTSPKALLNIAANNSAAELLIGDDWYTPTADSVTRVYIGNSAANSNVKIGQDSSNYGQLGWIYNATPASGYFLISTLSGGASAGNIAMQPLGGNVGIGTTTPETTLEIAGSGFAGIKMGKRTDAGSYSTALYFDTTTAGNYVVRGQEGKLMFLSGGTVNSSGGTDRVTFDTNGNVGVGTTSPSGILSVALTDTTKEMVLGLTANQFAKFKNSGAGGSFRIESSGALVLQENAASSTMSGVFFTNQYGETNNFISTDGTNSTYFNVLGGKVGIGTTGPGAQLQLNTIAGTDAFKIGSSTTQFIVDKSGNIGIGTTTPDSKLTVYASSGTKLLRLENSTLGTVVTFDNNGSLGLGVSTPNYVLDIASSTATNLLRVGTSTANTMFAVQSSQIQMNVPLNLNQTGNVQFGSDLEFTNDTAASILSNSPLYITAGDASQNVDLILKANNLGQVIIDDQLKIVGDGSSRDILTIASSTGTTLMTVTAAGNVGIGTTTPDSKLTVYNSGTTKLLRLENATLGTVVTFDNNGSLGLGVSTPNYVLDIASSTATNLFRVGTSTTNTMFAVQSTQIQANVPLNLNTSGDVQFGNDLEFTDNISASILSNSPLYITAGNAGQNVSVYLKGNGLGKVVADDVLYVASSTSIGFESTSTSNYIFAADWNKDGSNYAYVNNSNAWTGGSADYAEFFWTADTDLTSGEAVCVDVTRDNAVARCTRGADGNIMGIVSTEPAVLGNAPAGRENDKNYKIIGMLGQVPAKVTTENGPVRAGDSLTSSALYPGYMMKAEAGDSTVGVALESLSADNQDIRYSILDINNASSTGNIQYPISNISSSTTNTPVMQQPTEITKGKINVLISRRNKSLTVEEVEQKVTERVAAMEIEDEVRIMVQQSVDKYNFDPVVSKIIGTELASLSQSLEGKLTVQKNELTNLINNKETSLQEALGAIAAKVDLQGTTISQLQNNLQSINETISNIQYPISDIKILDIVNNSTSTALTVAQSGAGNIAEFKNASTTILAIKHLTCGDTDVNCQSRDMVVLANDVKLAFGDASPVTFAYNSQTDRLEILGTDKDLYVGLGTGRMIVGGATDLTPNPSPYQGEGAEGGRGVTLEVRGGTEIKTNASSTIAALTVGQNGSGDIIEFRNATFAVMTIKNSGEVQVASGKQTVCVGACPNTETFAPTTEGDLGVEASVYAQDYRVHCPEGWVEIPRDNKHTFNNFCVQKHEFASPLTPQPPLPEGEGAMPLVNVTLAEAKNYCRSLGEGMHLVTDAEWMTIAEQIAALPINNVGDNNDMQIANGNVASAAVVGTGRDLSLPDTTDPNINDCNLYKNLTDVTNAFSETCQISGTNSNTSDFGYTGTNANFAMSYDSANVGRNSLRTQVLPNGQIIWDIAGNAAEWVDEIANAEDAPIDSTSQSKWLEYPNITKYNNMSYLRPSGYNWTSQNGIGQIYTDYGSGSALRGFVRGGSFKDGAKAGVFGLDLSHSPSEASEDVGFRCAK